jgi:repressor LexA
MKRLTKRQQDALDYIKHCMLSHSIPPSIREVSRFMRSSSTGARCHIKALEKKGYIYLVPRQARNIRLTAKED